MRKTIGVAIASLLAAGAALATVPGTDLYVPAVGHGLGVSVNGVQAHWRADVWVFNPSPQTANVKLYLLFRGQANPSPQMRPATVASGVTLYLPDVVFNTFGADSTYGGLRITSDVPVVVTGRSYDANVTMVGEPTGTAGQFFSGIPAATAIGNGDSTDIVGLDQDGFQANGTWRSNLALVETTGNPVDLLLQRFDGAGNLIGSLPYHLDGRMVAQVNFVVTAITNLVGTDQRVNLSVTGGSGAVIAAASRIDNRTGDPSTVEMTGQGRTGSYLCELAKTNYPTPLRLTVAGGAVTALDTTIVFTDEDVATCGGELIRFAGPLPQPVFYDSTGAFSFSVSNPNLNGSGIGVTVQVNAAISTTGTVSGNATVTLANDGPCSGSRTWPLAGARAQ